jgi:hypothetical protein
MRLNVTFFVHCVPCWRMESKWSNAPEMAWQGCARALQWSKDLCARNDCMFSLKQSLKLCDVEARWRYSRFINFSEIKFHDCWFSGFRDVYIRTDRRTHITIVIGTRLSARDDESMKFKSVHVRWYVGFLWRLGLHCDTSVPLLTGYYLRALFVRMLR